MEHSHQFSTLEQRIYKLKNPYMSFICPLCSTERAFSTAPRLNSFNYIQVIFLTLLTSYFAWPVTGAKILPIFFLYYIIFEAVLKLRFKKDIPCPHCGFDATWYKKDVKIARQKVKEFWANKANTSEEAPIEEAPEETIEDPENI